MGYFPLKGDFFVCLNSGYDDVSLYKAYENKLDQNKLYAWWLKLPTTEGPGKEFREALDKLKPPFFPSFQYPRHDLSGLKKEYEKYWGIRNKIDDYLLGQDNYRALIKTVTDHLISVHGFKKTDIEDVLKVLISERLIFSYTKIESGEYLSFAELKANSEKKKKYYGSLAEEIKIRSNKISLLVSHGQTVGNYREHILRTLLRKYIPSKFSVATGFIVGKPYQIDIIIYDSHNYTPLFSEGELVVVDQEAVRAIIEVKTNLTTTTLKESLELFHSISLPGYRSTVLPMFKGVFAFESDYKKTDSIAKYVSDFYNEPYFEEKIQETVQRHINYLFHEITCISVLNHHCVFTQYENANGNDTDNIIPKLYSISEKKGNDIQTATFLMLLFYYLDTDYYAKKISRTGFTTLHHSPDVEMKMEYKLTKDDWLPNTYVSGEHESTPETVKARLEKMNDWFESKITSAEYVLKTFSR